MTTPRRQRAAHSEDPGLHATASATSVRLTRPLSTAPGPARRSGRRPASRIASSVSRQRTGRSRFSASSARTSRKGAAVPLRVDGDRRLAHRGGLQRGGQPLGGGRHERRVEGPGDVEQTAPRARLLACELGGLLHGRTLAGQDELPGRVVVGHDEPEPLRERAHRRLLAAQDRDHPAGLQRRGRGHGVRALVDEAQRVLELERARRHERRVLPERVARRRGRVGRALGLPGRHRAEEERRLLVARALLQAREGVVVQISSPRVRDADSR